MVFEASPKSLFGKLDYATEQRLIHQATRNLDIAHNTLTHLIYFEEEVTPSRATPEQVRKRVKVLVINANKMLKEIGVVG